MALVINLSEYGYNMGTRILAKKIIQDKYEDIIKSSSVVFDFNLIAYSSYSFLTEILSIEGVSMEKITFIHQNKMIDSLIKQSYSIVKNDHVN